MRISFLIEKSQIVKLSVLIFSACFLTTAVLNSCKKVDHENYYSFDREFFRLPENADPILRRIINQLQEQEKIKPFVADFVRSEGYPIWENAKISIKKSSLPSVTETSNDTIVSIPIVPEATELVKNILSVKVNDEIWYKMYKGEEYALYGFDKDPQRNEPNGNDVAIWIMEFERELFGDSLYKVRDTRLFDYWPDSITKTTTFYLKLAPTHVVDYDMGGGCNLVGVGYYDNANSWHWGWYFLYGNCGAPPSTGGTTVSIPPPLNGGDGWSIYFPPGGTGGGTTGNTGTNIECDRGWHKIAPVDGEDPGSSSTPEPCLDEIDQFGYYLSRKDELGLFLESHPFGILPCDELATLSLYASMWQDVASFTPSTPVLNRLNDLRNLNLSIVDNFNLQNLTDADGPVVNCDFFNIKIEQFPYKFPGSTRFTAREFLDYFRINLKNFVEPNPNVDFDCESSGISGWFNDCAKWNLPYEDALGALGSFKISLPYSPFSNSGTVIVSDYQVRNNSDGSTHYLFTFSTLETPFDHEHPVAGNRRFGIYNSPAQPDTWTMYTMGVDRTWDIFESGFNSIFNGFGLADDLWRRLQTNLLTFINEPSSQGSASLYANPEVIVRPRWEMVEKFLRKQMTMEELKTSLNCP